MPTASHARAMLSSLLVAVGCTKAIEPADMVPIDKVPSNVMKVAQEKLPGVKFDTAWKEKEATAEFYEVRGKSADGKTRDIRVSTDGKVLEVD